MTNFQSKVKFGAKTINNYSTENKSFSYSGDTLPSLLFCYISLNADAFIHEASFLESQIKNAIETFHSTEERAMKIFKKSGAKKCLLTHFSNRNTIEDGGLYSVIDFYRYDFT